MRRSLNTALCLSLVVGCGGDQAVRSAALGTPGLRAALFDTILARTARREAFSAPKNQALGFDPLRDMAALRDAVIAARTEEELFHALSRVSNARRDRHLDVALVPGGLTLPTSYGVPVAGGEDPAPPPQAPIRVLPDFATDAPAYFVADVAPGAGSDAPAPGDRILAVNGQAIDAWEAAVAPHVRHSSRAGLRWRIAEILPQRTGLLPSSMQGDVLRLETERPDGTRRAHALAYQQTGELVWTGGGEPRYPGFQLERSTGTYDLYLPDEDRPVVLLRWHGFRETLVPDVDSLVAIGARSGRLDHALIIDATRSRGGSLGPYALQRLQSRPFRTTFGNLRLSDVIAPFIEERTLAFQRRQVTDNGVPETIDDGTWLIDWLRHDVEPALARGEAWSNDVPFKVAHAPRDADGVLQPAPVHFRGPLVVLSGPHGGSHLDQFVSIIVDNDLGHVVGMPAGGYSNTWEWEEVLTFPGTAQPVVRFMWSIGHTIRPNGQVLEGNPAQVDELLPVTRENFALYYDLLLGRALAHFATLGHPAGRGLTTGPVRR